MMLLAKQYTEEGLRNAVAGNRDLAEYQLLKAHELHPSFRSCSTLGWFYGIHLESLEEGFRYFRKAIRHAPLSGDSYNECGNLLLKRGKVKESVKWFHRALRCEENPRKHFVLYNLALVYTMWNRPERSVRYLNLALRFQPDFLKARHLLMELKSDLIWKSNLGHP
jgi:Tfp pilus assembly protein PilF